MKKIIAFALCLTAIVVVSCKEENKAIPFEKLPALAQQFVKAHFGDLKTAYVTMDKDDMEKDYEVGFTGGGKIEFDRKGEWKEIDFNRVAVPTGAIPAKINEYVTANYPELHIVKLEQDRKGYEAKLSSGLELKFDRNFNLIGFD